MFSNELHPIVIWRIVASGYHDPAVKILVEGGKVCELCSANTDIESIHTRICQTSHERFRQCIAGITNISANRNSGGIDEFGVGTTDPIRDVFV